jgi:hypothetical protein
MSSSRWSEVLPSGRLRRAAGVLALIVVGIGVSVAIGRVLDFDSSPGPNIQSLHGSGVNDRLGKIHVTPCDQQEPGRIALLGRLAPGRTLANLSSAGYVAAQAIDGAEDDLVVIDRVAHPGSAPFTLPDLLNAPNLPANLQTDAAFVSVGWLSWPAKDLSLRSCDYTLSDKPAPSAIAKTAVDFMIEKGVLTQAQIDAGGTTFMLAEDPTNPAHLFFTVVLAKPTDGGPGSPPNSELLTPYAATIDKATGTVLSAGRAHWYDGQ